jgi:hypothetical protein
MLNGLPHRYEFVFRNPKIDREKRWSSSRKLSRNSGRHLFQKLKNERINAINFRTLRHFTYPVYCEPGITSSSVSLDL